MGVTPGTLVIFEGKKISAIALLSCVFSISRGGFLQQAWILVFQRPISEVRDLYDQARVNSSSQGKETAGEGGLRRRDELENHRHQPADQQQGASRWRGRNEKKMVEGGRSKLKAEKRCTVHSCRFTVKIQGSRAVYGYRLAVKKTNVAF